MKAKLPHKSQGRPPVPFPEKPQLVIAEVVLKNGKFLSLQLGVCLSFDELRECQRQFDVRYGVFSGHREGLQAKLTVSDLEKWYDLPVLQGRRLR